MSYLLLFLAGSAASLHCVGMCGIFPLSLSSMHSTHDWRRQLLYNFGRVNTLIVIGAVSGTLGAVLVASGPLHRLQQLLAFVTGLVMLLVAAEMLGVLTRITSGGAALAQATVGRALGSTMRSRSWAAPLALGVFNAFLPCQLIYAFAARAASTASPYEGMLTMLSFGLGTVPAMLAVGRLRAHSRLLLHTQLSRLAALIVLGFGLVTLLRALDWLPGGLHTHH